MKTISTNLPEVLLVELDAYTDARGVFLEAYRDVTYAAHGIGPFVQDNLSRSRQGVLRGLHYQLRRPQGKLVQVLAGAVFDVAVDVRRGSPRFGRWCGAVLSEENRRQIWIPPGFAHGFQVIGEHATVMYKVTDYQAPGDEYALRWDDPELGIEWPECGERLLSARDAAAPLLADAGEQLPA